ncbi:MAG: branched-chain amino acid ABC transporter permease [Desulfitobacteriaceae bacterium]
MKKMWKNWFIQVIMVLIILVVTGLVAKGLAMVVPPYYMQIGFFVGINIIVILGLNLITGVTGQLTLGHAAFMSIGAYSSAISTVTYHIPFLLAILIGGLVAGIFGVIIGFPSLRLDGDYLAIATLGFAEIAKVQITNMNITGGAIGFRGIKQLSTFPIIMVIMVMVLFAVFWLENSRNGRAMLAVREDEVASATMGINTTLYKIQAFTIGAFCAGIGGALYAHAITFIQPNDFGFMKSIELLSMAVLGGLGSIPGMIIGATVLTVAPEALRFMANYRMIVYGLLLIILMAFRPYGLIGRINLRQAIRRALMILKKNKVRLGA